MGRTSDYTKQVRNEECENTVETKKNLNNQGILHWMSRL